MTSKLTLEKLGHKGNGESSLAVVPHVNQITFHLTVDEVLRSDGIQFRYHFRN